MAPSCVTRKDNLFRTNLDAFRAARPLLGRPIMSTKSKARRARRHPEDNANQASGPQSLLPDQKRAAGEIMGAVLNMVTLGAVEPKSAR